jgi:DNA-binding NtrC family response regulator
MAKILCVDDEATALTVIRATLDHADQQSIGVTNVDAALAVLARGGIDLVISDYRMPGATGLDLLVRMRERDIGIPLIIATGFGSIEHAVEAIKAGAVDYIVKPVRGPQPMPSARISPCSTTIMGCLNGFIDLLPDKG